MLEKSQTSASQANQERKVLSLQINALTDQVKKLQNENKDLRNELERLWNKRPEDRKESFLVEEFRKLENLSDERDKKFREEIASLKEQLYEKNEKKDIGLRNEMSSLQEKIGNLEEILKDKEKEIENLKKTKLNPKSSKLTKNTQSSTTIILELKSEKEKLERNLDRTIKMSCEKESQLSDEIIRLKTLTSSLSEQKDIKEKELKDRISLLLEEIENFKQKILEIEKKANNDKNLLQKEKNSIQASFESLEKNVKQSEAFSTFYTLKGDLQRANETICSQEAMIEQLKEAAFHTLDFVPTKEKGSDVKQIVAQLQKDFYDYSQKQKSSEDLHNSELLSRNSEIINLQNEISELRHKILIFESKKYESELMIVRTDLHKAVAERSHAKKLIISYIRSVQVLEKMIHDKQDTESVSAMFKLEINRLNEENKSLVESKQSLEEFYQSEIKGLEAVCENLNTRIQELETKIDCVNKNRVKENTDELKSWILKNKQLQELNKRLVDTLALVENRPSGNGKKNLQGFRGNNENKKL